MRVRLASLAPIALAAALAACGGSARTGVVLRASEPLPDGEAVYRVRYNPPPCLADQPELHAEVSTPAGWERVALETSSDETDAIAALLGRFDHEPSGVVPVLGTLTNRVRQWSGQHASRVFVVQVVDPPVEPEEPDEPTEDDEPPEGDDDPSASVDPPPPV